TPRKRRGRRREAMSVRNHPLSRGPLAAYLLAILASAAAAEEYQWEASSGLFPDQVDCRFQLFNSSDPEAPELAGGILTVGNDQHDELMVYQMTGDAISVPAVSVVAWRARFVSGGSLTPSKRTGMTLAVTTAPEVGLLVCIGDG